MATLSTIVQRGKTPVLILVAAGALVYAFSVEHRAQQEAAPPTAAQQSQLSSAEVVAEARLVPYPGASAVVGSDLAGTVVELSVQEKDAVKKGQLLALVRAEDLDAALAEAQARLRETDADLTLAQTEMQRTQRLLKAEVVPRQQLEKAQRDYDAARAKRGSVEAEIRRVQALLKKSRVISPISGTVTGRHVELGESVQAGSHIVTVADLSRTRVEAEVDEFDVFAVKVGDAVDILAEGATRSWRGRVEEIPDSVSQRRIKPQDPGKPSDARVLLVKIALDAPAPIKLGQRLEVKIHGSGRR